MEDEDVKGWREEGEESTLGSGGMEQLEGEQFAGKERMESGDTFDE